MNAVAPGSERLLTKGRQRYCKRTIATNTLAATSDAASICASLRTSGNRAFTAIAGQILFARNRAYAVDHFVKVWFETDPERKPEQALAGAFGDG